MTKRIIIVVAIILVLLGLLLAGVYGPGYLAKTKLAGQVENFQVKYDTALVPHDAGKWDESITLFQEALTVAPSAGSAAQTRLKIANDLFFRNHGNDREDAYTMYKANVADTSIPPLQRALALNDMAFTMDIWSDDKAMMMLFSGSPYADILKQSGGDMHIATRRLYEWSNSIFPTALARTQIGFMAAVPLANGSSMPGKTKTETAQFIQQYLAEAKPLFDAIPYEPSKKAHMYLCYTMALSVSDTILHNIAFADIENGYKKAISDAQTDKENVYSQGTEAAARLFYAITLNNRFGATKADDVRDLLKTFGTLERTPQHEVVFTYVQNVSKRPDTDFAKKQIIALAKVSPEFKSLLQRLGWSV